MRARTVKNLANGSNKINIKRIFNIQYLVLFAYVCTSIFTASPVYAQTTCPDLGSSFGSANYSLSNVVSGNHRLWLRMKSTDGAASIKYSLSGGGMSCDQTATTTGATNWKWVQSSAAFTTTGGTVAVQLAGIKTGVGVDCFVLTSDSAFNPSTSADCLGPQVDVTVPVVTFTEPAQNATVSGSIVSKVTATDVESGIKQVIFSVSSNSSLSFTDATAPFEYTLDTKLLTNGSAVISAVATNNVNLSASTARNIIVNNSSPASPKAGDVDGDGVVNLRDFSILASNFGKSGLSRAQGDLSGDGTVGLVDFSILASNFGK